VEKLVRASANMGTQARSQPSEGTSWLYDYTIDWDERSTPRQ
jgi:hypothetical protein